MKKYSAVLFASALSVCTVTSSACGLGVNYKVLASETVATTAATTAKQSEQASETEGTTQTTTEATVAPTTAATATTTATTEEKNTVATTATSAATTQSTTEKGSTTAKKENTKKIKTKNKVKHLKKDKNLKEEKVTANIIPQIYNDTRLSMKNSKEMIGNFIYFNQGDAAWNQNGYCIKSAGCGPTAMAVCISSLTSQWVTPLDTTIWAYNNGYYSNAGSSHDMIPALAKQYQLNCNGLGTNYESIKAALKAGHPVVGLMGPGYFTKGGHFIVLVAIDDQNQVTVADVGSRQRSTYKYLLKDVIGQSKAASAGGPFWEISNPNEKGATTAKKEKVIKTKETMVIEYRTKDIKSVLQNGYSIAVPMYKGSVSEEEGFVTLTGINQKDEVTVKGTDSSKQVLLDTIVKELNTKAIKGTFWEMVHPLQKNDGPTMSDYLLK